MDNTAFIIDRSGGTIFHSLRHIVDIDIITEHLTSIAVLCRDGRTCKTNKGSIRQCLADNTGITNNHMCFLFTLGIFRHDNFLVETILTTVRLVCHDHNISALGQWLFATFKFEHGSKDYAIGTASFQQSFQMFFAFCLHWCLTQEFCTLGKLGVQLIIQVNAVRHNHNCGAVQHLLQQVCVEHHGQRLTTALSMPEYTALAVILCCNLSFLYSLADCKVLMITCQDLDRLLTVAGKEYEILQNVQQSRPLEKTFTEGVKIRIACSLNTVFGFPLHEPIQAGSNGTSLVSGKITDYADGIVYKQGGNVLHIVADLIIGVLYTSFFL